MSNFNQFIASAYSPYEPNLPVFGLPIIAKQTPTTANKAPLGTVWVVPATNQVFILTSIVNNLANWSGAMGVGSFTSLTVQPGPVTMITGASNGAFTLGNATNTGLIDLEAGPGGLNINGNGNLITIANDAAANSLILGTVTVAATTLIEGGDGTGVGTAGITIMGAVAGDIQIGSVAHTGAIYLGVSTAGDTINIASGINTGAEVVNILNSATGANATVNILSGVGTAGAGVLALGNNQRVTTIGLGNIAPAAARTITVAGGNSAQNDTVNILDGNPSAGTQTVSILSGTPTGGTQVLNLGAQTTHAVAVNIGSGTGLATVHIANGAAANVVTLGSVTGAASTTIQAGTGSIALIAAGAVSMVPATASVASATTTVTLNSRVGVVTWTGFTTANAGATQAFTFTNSTVLATSAIFVTVTHLNASTNGANLRLEDVTVAAGSFIVKYSNNGAGALGAGDSVLISYWVLS